MSWLLKKDKEASSYLRIDGGRITCVGDFSITFIDFILHESSAPFEVQAILGNTSNFDYYIAILDSKWRVRIGAEYNIPFSSVPEPLTSADLIVSRSGSVVTLSFGGASSSIETNTNNFPVDGFGGAQLGRYYPAGFSTSEIELTANGSTWTWSAGASDHSASAPDQPVLTETVSGNNATGVNMPTDGSCWIQTGSVGYTIEAVSGSYSYSGQSVGLNNSKILSALTSNYTYSGSASLLLKDSTFYSDSTMYAQDGVSVEVLSDRLLLPNTSQYLSAGTDVSLLKNSNVIASTGNYSYTGYPVTITHSTVTNYTLDIDSGLYGSVGVELNILSGNLLVTADGGYLVDGISITTLLSRVLGVDTDIYNLVGTAVNITYTPAGGYILSLDNGVYQLSPDEITLLKTNTLSVEDGAYTSEGKSLGFMFGRVFRCSDGSYIVDGSDDTNLLVNKLITPDVGIYQYQGDLVRLKYSGVVLIRVDGYRVWFESSPVTTAFKDDAVSVKFKY